MLPADLRVSWQQTDLIFGGGSNDKLNRRRWCRLGWG
jgi:hypothetical protein